MDNVCITKSVKEYCDILLTELVIHEKDGQAWIQAISFNNYRDG